MARDRSKIGLIEWLNSISDNTPHHIGEYFTARYGKPWKKKSTDNITKAMYNWFIWQNSNEMGNMIMNHGFEILRDNNGTFFVRKKE